MADVTRVDVVLRAVLIFGVVVSIVAVGALLGSAEMVVIAFTVMAVVSAVVVVVVLDVVWMPTRVDVVRRAVVSELGVAIGIMAVGALLGSAEMVVTVFAVLILMMVVSVVIVLGGAVLNVVAVVVVVVCDIVAVVVV